MALEKYRGDSFRRSAGSRSARNSPDRSCKNLVHTLAIHIYDFKAPAADIYMMGDRRYTPESHNQKSAQCLKPAVLLTRTKPKDYARSKFIRRVKGYKGDFAPRSRPSFYMKVYLPYYRSRTRLELLIKGVPLVDARWIGDLMGCLSPELIADAFHDACYTQEQVSM